MHWVIGDIHGMLKPLEALLRRIEALDSARALVFAGDYVNRGPNSRGVVDLLLGLSGANFVRGNHDDVFDLLINQHSMLPGDSQIDRPHAFRWFRQHGLIQTFQSYGATDALLDGPMQRKRADALEPLIALLPIAHRTFFESLPGVFETAEFFVVHGKWPRGLGFSPGDLGDPEEIPPNIRREMLWGRYTDGELTDRPAWSKPGYFGHTPVQSYRGHEANSRPIVLPMLTLLDTGAALLPFGRLTAVCVQSGQVIQVDREGRSVESD